MGHAQPSGGGDPRGGCLEGLIGPECTEQARYLWASEKGDSEADRCIRDSLRILYPMLSREFDWPIRVLDLPETRRRRRSALDEVLQACAIEPVPENEGVSVELVPGGFAYRGNPHNFRPAKRDAGGPLGVAPTVDAAWWNCSAHLRSRTNTLSTPNR